MMLEDNLQVHDEIVDIGVYSGGGAMGIWSFTVAKELKRRGYEMDMVAGSSTGCIVAYLYAKGFWEEAELLYKKTYEEGSRNIFEPGIASVKKGKLDINWIKAIPAVFRIKHVKSLMTNKGLYETFLALEKKSPKWEKDMFFNTFSARTGISTQHWSRDFDGRPEDLAAAMTASTSMPAILPMWDFGPFKVNGDGGTTHGLPLQSMFARMEPKKDYRFWNVMCNPIDLMPIDDLDNVAKVAGRTLNIMLNGNLISDIRRTEDKNEVAKVIWPISDKLESMGLIDLSDELRSKLGYRHMPIHNVIYSGNRGVFEFTMESYEEQIQTAIKDVDQYITANKL